MQPLSPKIALYNTHHPSRTPKAIHLLLLVFLSLCALTTFSVKIPGYPIEAPTRMILPRVDQYHPDEPRHIAEIEYMARYHWLPPFETRKEMQLYGDSYHPPCYYVLCAIIWAICKPLLGRSGSILLLRLLSGLMGAGTVYYAYLAARLLVPRRTALLAAACVAGVPMFLSTSASISNETLNALAASIAIYYLTLGIRRGFTTRVTLLLSAWIAIGVSSKFTCVGLIPAAWFALWWAGHKRRQPLKILFQQMLWVLGLSVLAVGWFLVRNVMLYGDLFRFKAWTNYYGGDSDGFESHHLRDHISWKGYARMCADFGWRSFWGAFDRLEVLLPEKAYTALAVLHAASLVGLARLARRGWLNSDRLGVMLAMGIFALILIYEFFKFNWWHLSPQGRYFFPWLVPFGILTAAGWLALFPRRLRSAASLLLLAALFTMNVYVYARYPFHPISVEHAPEKLQ